MHSRIHNIIHNVYECVHVVVMRRTSGRLGALNGVHGLKIRARPHGKCMGVCLCEDGGGTANVCGSQNFYAHNLSLSVCSHVVLA